MRRERQVVCMGRKGRPGANRTAREIRTDYYRFELVGMRLSRHFFSVAAGTAGANEGVRLPPNPNPSGWAWASTPGSLMRPAKRISPVRLSRIRTRNGRSARKTLTGGCSLGAAAPPAPKKKKAAGAKAGALSPEDRVRALAAIEAVKLYRAGK